MIALVFHDDEPVDVIKLQLALERVPSDYRCRIKRFDSGEIAILCNEPVPESSIEELLDGPMVCHFGYERIDIG